MTCTVCLEASPPPVHTGCACRGGNGLMHLACLLQCARSQERHRGHVVWGKCQLCKHSFTGETLVAMAREWVDASRTLRSRRHLVESLLIENRNDEADVAVRALVNDARRDYGTEDVRTAVCEGLLAVSMSREGKYAEASALFVPAIRAIKLVFGATSSVTLQAVANYACSLMHQGRSVEAERMNRALVATMRDKFGETDASTLVCMGNLAVSLAAQAKFTEARALCADALRVQARVFGADHVDTKQTVSRISIYEYQVAFPLEDPPPSSDPPAGPIRPRRPTVRLPLSRIRK
jgi:hypothetical protein